MRALVLATFLVGSLLAGCSGEPSHYVAALDELKVPPGWVVLGTKIHGPADGADISCSPITDSECPSVLRFYTVQGQPDAARDAAKVAVIGARYEVEWDLGASCTPVSGSAYCAFRAVRGKDRMFVAIYGNAGTAGIPKATAPGPVVVITASG